MEMPELRNVQGGGLLGANRCSSHVSEVLNSLDIVVRSGARQATLSFHLFNFDDAVLASCAAGSAFLWWVAF